MFSKEQKKLFALKAEPLNGSLEIFIIPVSLSVVGNDKISLIFPLHFWPMHYIMYVGWLVHGL